GGVRAAAGPGPARGARGTGAADGGGALLDPSRRAPVRRVPAGGRVRLRAPDVAISHRLRPPPYGGSNQFLLALRGELERRGLRVSDGPIPRRARSVLLHAYLLEGRPPRGRRVVHRVDGPVGLYRGADDGADSRIAELNRELADATILQSRYSLEAHLELGIELRDPVVVPNSVDPAIFYAPAGREPLAGRRVRVVATSWSDNPLK